MITEVMFKQSLVAALFLWLVYAVTTGNVVGSLIGSVISLAFMLWGMSTVAKAAK